MPVNHAIWKVGDKPQALSEVPLGKEALLEQMIVQEPSILSDRWLLIGRQVRTSHGGYIDLLALNQDGQLIVIELKRSLTPREVVAQALDYASWVQNLTSDKIAGIYDEYTKGGSLGEAFKQRFGIDLDEEQLNGSHQVVVVASMLDPSTERIVNYLNGMNVPINVIFFQVFQDGENQYLSRAWLIDPVETESKATGGQASTKGEWNGEYYVSFGHDATRDWNEAVKYGFISGGGGTWYSKTLQMLSPGDRVWVNVPRYGYVGVGRVTGPVARADQFTITVDGVTRPFLEVAQADYMRDLAEDEEKASTRSGGLDRHAPPKPGDLGSRLLRQPEHGLPPAHFEVGPYGRPPEALLLRRYSNRRIIQKLSERSSMNEAVLQHLRGLRNARAHHGGSSPQTLGSELSSLGISIADSDLDDFLRSASNVVDRYSNALPPPLLQEVIAALVKDRQASNACDPWANIATPIGWDSVVATLSPGNRRLALTRSADVIKVGSLLLPDIEWATADALSILPASNYSFDLVATVLPLGAKSDRALQLKAGGAGAFELKGDLGEQILTVSALTLSPGGLGLYVVAPSFFISEKSIFRRFHELGLKVSAAFTLPNGLFAPATNVATYLALVTKGPVGPMFVAQLSGDSKANSQALSNYHNGEEGGSLELGRFVDPSSFRGIDRLEFQDWIGGLERRLGTPLVDLESLATEMHVGRSGDNFAFKKLDNAVYIPVVGNSEVVDSLEALHITPQNYIQVAIDPNLSQSRFVASFLNSDVGREMRERMKAGVIPRLNSAGVRALKIFVPLLDGQARILEQDSKLWASQNVLQGLENELLDIRRSLWSGPGDVTSAGRVDSLYVRVNEGFGSQAAQSLEQWFETLPFPLASILRTWQATSESDA